MCRSHQDAVCDLKIWWFGDGGPLHDEEAVRYGLAKEECRRRDVKGASGGCEEQR